MKVSEAILIMNGGVKSAQLAKNIGIGEKKLRAALHSLGFTYSQSTRIWSFTGDGEEPQDINILDIVSYKKERRVKSNSRANSSKREQTSPNASPTDEVDAPNISPTYELKFTREQFDVLVTLANERLNQSQEQATRESIHLRIMALKTESRTRKTVLMDDKIGSRFDKFAERVKLPKSDLLSVALSNFLDSYDVE